MLKRKMVVLVILFLSLLLVAPILPVKAFDSPYVIVLSTTSKTITYPLNLFQGKPTGENISKTLTLTTSGAVTVSYRNSFFTFNTTNPSNGWSLLTNGTHYIQRFSSASLAYDMRWEPIYGGFGYQTAWKLSIEGSSSSARTIVLKIDNNNTLELKGNRFTIKTTENPREKRLGFDWGDALLYSPEFVSNGKIIKFYVPAGSFNIDPVTVVTSTDTEIYQGGSFSFKAQTKYWQFWNDGNLKFKTSSDGTSWSATSNAHATDEGTVYANSTHIAMLLIPDADNSKLNYALGTLVSDGTITWGTTYTVFDHTNPLYAGFLVAFNSKGAYYIVTASDGTSNEHFGYSADDAGSGTWTDTAVTSAFISINHYLLPLSNGSLAMAYAGYAGSTLRFRLYTNSGINAEEVASSSTLDGYGATVYSLGLAEYNSNIYAFFKTSSNIKFAKRALASTGFGTEVTVHTGGTNFAPHVAGTLANSELNVYVLDRESASATTWDLIRYRVTPADTVVNTGVLVNSESDVFVDTGSTGLPSHFTISSTHQNNNVSLSWIQGTGAPYNIRFQFNVPTANAAPTNGVASITDMDDTDNIYAQKKLYTGSSVATDTDGYGDIDYMEFRLKQGGTTRAIFRYDEDTNAFSVESGSTEWSLDATSSAVESGNDITVTWKFTPQWDATEEADLEIEVYVIDAMASADTDTAQSNYVDVVKTLTVSSFASDPVTYVNPSASLTMSGTVYYVNNPASSTASTSYPPDAEFTSVIIHDSAHATMATDSVIVNGAFSVAITAEATAGARTVHPYINMADADYTDADASGITDSYTVYATLTISAIYQFDQSTSLTAGLYLSYQDTTNGTGPTKYAYTASKTFYSIVPNDVIRLKVQWTNTSSTDGGVQVNGSASVDITMDAVYTRTLYLSVFKSTVLAFQYSDASTSFPTAKVTSVVVTNTGNTTTLTLTTFSNIGLVRNGTYTISSTNIFGGDIKSTTSFTVTADSSTKTLVAKVHKPTLNFRRNDGTALTPTSFTVTAPNNSTSLVLTSFTNLVMVEGAYTPTALTYWAVDVKKNGTAFTPTSMSGQFTFNALIYSSTKLVFQYSDASTSFPAASVTSVVYTNPNGTQKTVTVFTDIGLITTGSATVDQVNIFGVDVKSTASFSVTADSSTKTLVAKVHKPTLNFRRADKSTAFTPTSFVVTAPGNLTSLTLSSYSTLVMVEGAYTPSSLNMYGVDVKENATTFTPTSMSQQFTFNGKLYAVTLNFRDAASSSVTPTSIAFTAPNSSAVSLTSGSITVTTVGSHSVSSISKYGFDLRKNASDSFSPTSNGQGFTYNLNLHNLVAGADTMPIYALSGVTLGTPSWNADQKRASFTSTSGTVYLRPSATLGKPIFISFDGQEKGEGSGWTYDGTTVTITVSGTNLVVSWTSSGTVTPSGSGSTGSGGGGEGGGGGSIIGPGVTTSTVVTTTTTTTNTTLALPSAPTISIIETPSDNLLTGGTLAIVFIVTVALVWKEVKKRASPGQLFSMRSRQLTKKNIKWPKMTRKKIKWPKPKMYG